MPSVSDRAILFWIVVTLIVFLMMPLVLNSVPGPVTSPAAPPVGPLPTTGASAAMPTPPEPPS